MSTATIVIIVAIGVLIGAAAVFAANRRRQAALDLERERLTSAARDHEQQVDAHVATIRDADGHADTKRAAAEEEQRIAREHEERAREAQEAAAAAKARAEEAQGEADAVEQRVDHARQAAGFHEERAREAERQAEDL